MSQTSESGLKVVFLGVGESCDEKYPNTSLLVSTPGSGEGNVLLDCGFTVPPRFFAHISDPEALGAIWISHFHGDHFFGLPLLLLRFREMERRRKLFVVGQSGVEQIVGAAMELAYPGFRDRLTFELVFHVLEQGPATGLCGLDWRVALNGHSQKDLALRLDSGKHSVFYSGDGRPTRATRDLARGCGLVVHEAYGVDESVPGHSSVEECVDFAREAGAPRLALVHLQRDVRRNQAGRIRQIMGRVEDVEVLLPDPGDSLHI